MRAFVTGGSGYLGRNLIAALCARGDQVVALARSPAAVAAVTAAGAEPVYGDLEDFDKMGSGMRGCDVVYHCAALAADWGSEAEFMRINVTGTQNVLSVARSSEVRRVVHVSTEAVLVDGTPIVNADETRPRAAKPVGLYPLTKGLAEQAALEANAPDFSVMVVRPRFIWGKDDSVLLPRLIKQMESGAFAWIGGKEHLTSTCHVDNVIEGMILAAERGKGGEIYFLTDGDSIPMAQMIREMVGTRGIQADRFPVLPLGVALGIASMAELVWRALRLKGTPPITRTGALLIGQEVTVNDQKARHELGYVGRVSREQGFAGMRQKPHPASPPSPS